MPNISYVLKSGMQFKDTCSVVKNKAEKRLYIQKQQSKYCI